MALGSLPTLLPKFSKKIAGALQVNGAGYSRMN
jgi:hypothetical protein